MNRREALLAAGALAAGVAARAAPAEPTLPLARDLRADGLRAREARVPIVVLYSLPGCPHCEVVRRSHLEPMLRETSPAAKPVIRQVDLNGMQALVGFSGEATTHGRFALERGIRMAPVVHFLSPSGEAIAPPLVGMLLPDFYGAYLADSLAAARESVRGAKAT